MQKNLLGLTVVLVFATTIFVGAAKTWADDGSGSATDVKIASFIEHVAKSGKLDAAQLDAFRKSVEELGQQDIESAITEGLAKVYPGYREAVQASDDDNLTAARASLGGLLGSSDKFLAADASFYLARTLMNHERFEEALPLLRDLNGNLADFSAHTQTVQYYEGLAFAGLLQTEDAVRSLMEFLQFNPDAPERLRVSAWRRIQELQSITAGQMDDIYQRMDFSRRRLEIVEPGDRTQEEQDKIVKMLKALITEQEKKECSNCSGKSKSESQSESEPKKDSQKSEQEKSESQKGGQSNVANGKFVEKDYDTGDASPWSRLRDRSRDPANTAIKDKLPARYREIVERYYDAVNKDESAGDSGAKNDK